MPGFSSSSLRFLSISFLDFTADNGMNTETERQGRIRISINRAAKRIRPRGPATPDIATAPTPPHQNPIPFRPQPIESHIAVTSQPYRGPEDLYKEQADHCPGNANRPDEPYSQAGKLLTQASAVAVAGAPPPIRRRGPVATALGEKEDYLSARYAEASGIALPARAEF
ncbi:hypothetical protein DL764_010864 [Monosporascus ibericus]|uniref:Uncharacterized protein n=1 Tax=Monosporascus ibericus TaxID=155417 RepID=A0A4Q4SRY1_9PEZI|nr:hypothetical protein DL764_010864 [Monosporascus ibericus]